MAGGIPACADAFDHRPDPWSLVAGRVVHHHDVVGLKLGQQHLFDIGFKADAVDRPVDNEGRYEALVGERSDEGRGFPVAVRNADAQARASGAPAMAAHHVCRSPGLVNEDEARRIETELAVEPFAAPLQDVGTVLFRGMRALFYA